MVKLNSIVKEKLKNKLDGLPFYNDLENLTYKVPTSFLIESAGWKGKKIGNIRISKEHALVLILEGEASSEEIINFSSLIINDIEKKYGVTLEVEPNML